MDRPAKSTFDSVKAQLRERFADAKLFAAAPPDWEGEGVEWAGLRFAPGDNSYIGVTEEALDHPQNLLAQLEESIDDIGPGRRRIVILTDRSDDARYQL